MRSVVHGSAKLISTLTSSANGAQPLLDRLAHHVDRRATDERRQQLDADPALARLDAAHDAQVDDGDGRDLRIVHVVQRGPDRRFERASAHRVALPLGALLEPRHGRELVPQPDERLVGLRVVPTIRGRLGHPESVGRLSAHRRAVGLRPPAGSQLRHRCRQHACVDEQLLRRASGVKHGQRVRGERLERVDRTLPRGFP